MSYTMLIVLLPILAIVSGKFCAKRLVGGKWITHGDCGNHGRLINGLKEEGRVTGLITKFIEREIYENANATIFISTAQPGTTVAYSSCRDVKMESANSQNKTGGVFDITIPEVGTKEVYCDTTVDGGNWTVFQRRMDGSVDFNRNWTEYVDGFGTPNGEHWLGLEAIHQLSKNGSVQLRIDMIEQDGTYYYASYNFFKLGPGSDDFRLNVSGYSGNATDSFASPANPYKALNGQQFSTIYNDNDQSLGNCASLHKSGWWFNSCFWSNMNGLYIDGSEWFHPGEGRWLKMQFTEMKLRNNEV